MKEYVLTLLSSDCIVSEDGFVLLIEKDRPAWQKGLLNLPGGKVEEGETPEVAAVREVKEETGIEIERVHRMGEIRDRDFIIHCFRAYCHKVDFNLKPRDGETEIPTWMEWHDAIKDKRLIPNLRVIMPLMLKGVSGWVIEDNGGPDVPKGQKHQLKISVPGYV